MPGFSRPPGASGNPSSGPAPGKTRLRYSAMSPPCVQSKRERVGGREETAGIICRQGLVLPDEASRCRWECLAHPIVRSCCAHSKGACLVGRYFPDHGRCRPRAPFPPCPASRRSPAAASRGMETGTRGGRSGFRLLDPCSVDRLEDCMPQSGAIPGPVRLAGRAHRVQRNRQGLLLPPAVRFEAPQRATPCSRQGTQRQHRRESTAPAGAFLIPAFSTICLSVRIHCTFHYRHRTAQTKTKRKPRNRSRGFGLDRSPRRLGAGVNGRSAHCVRFRSTGLLRGMR